MQKQNILVLCFIVIINFNSGWCNDQEEEQLQLKDLLQNNNYDKRVRPSGEGGTGPTVVETNLYVRDIDFIDEKDHKYGIQITFRQKWQDKRLVYNASSSSNLKFLTLLDVTQVWTPDLFFSNEKESRLHDLMKPNHFIRIYPSGDILYSSRISLKLSCPMTYKSFPFDKQTCSMKMASYGYIDKEVSFHWKEVDPIQIASTLAISKFDLETFSQSKCDTTTNTGTYSCLKFDLVFSRIFSPYLVNVYIPCTMFVIAAWLGTFLDKKSVTARVLTALATLYVMATQVSHLNTTVPTTAYTKAIDKWTGSCLTFVFATLVEFIIINHLSKSETAEENQNGDCVVDNGKQESIKVAATKWLVGNQNTTSDKIDSIFRTVYPIAFILFTAIYFIAY